LKPRRQIKVVGQWAGVNYDLFRGFVAGWPVEYSVGGKDSTVSIDCFDALGLMANETVPTDWLGYYTQSLLPFRYFKFDDSPSDRKAVDKIGGIQITAYTGSSLFQSEPLSPGIISRSLFLNGQYGAVADTSSNDEFTFSIWTQGVVNSTSRYTFEAGINGFFFIFSYNATSAPALTFRLGTTSYSLTFSAGTDALPAYDQPTHWVFRGKISTATYSAFANGVALAYTVSSIPATAFTQEYYLTSRAIVQELSVFKRVLTDTEVRNLYNFGVGQIIETTTARLDRIVSTTDFPSTLKSFAHTPIASVSDITSQNGVVPEMHRIVDSEDSDLFVSASGVLTFFDRYGWASRTRSNTSQVTFTDTGTGVYYNYQSIAVDLNADQIRNDTTIQFSSGGVVTSIDQTSVAEYGAASEQVSTFLPDPASAQTLADYRVAVYSQPKIEVEPFLVKGQRNPSYDWPRLLNLELLDRFTFVRTPSVGSAIQKDMLLQSVEHRITPGTWETIINGSARYTGWFIIGVSLIGGEDVLL
jgi:hypothetical protein